MPRQRRMPVEAGVGADHSLDTPTLLHPTPQPNKPLQTTAGAPLMALYTRLTEVRGFAEKEATAYITGVTLNSGGGPRIHVLIYSRSGRYVHTWQPRRRFGQIHVQRVYPDNPAYSFLKVYLGKSRIPCNLRESVRLAMRFLAMLGEQSDAVVG